MALLSSLMEQCHHRQNYSHGAAMIYCLALAVLFVGCLYALVPAKVQKLDRDHPRHIRWRALASFIVSVISMVTYPLFFCDGNKDSMSFSMDDILWKRRYIFGVLLHTMILYTGPITVSLIRLREIRRRARSAGKPVVAFVSDVFDKLILPTLLSFLAPNTARERWQSIRNFVVAPWTEEIVFRGCMVSALLGSGMAPWKVALVAPLFFGVAHAHHAFSRLKKGERIGPVLMMTLFQFAYTSLFGAYAAHALIRTGSVSAVTCSHAYCNWMGLPDLGFMQPHHPMYQHRMTALASFLVGAFGFKLFFSSGWLLPLPPELPAIVCNA